MFNEDNDRNSLFEDSDQRRGQSRKSFVGTALYISPEMLNDNLSLPAMDLWALGCIIYQMRVGQTPFSGSIDYEVFQKITDRQLIIPNELEPEAVDIIDKLLQLDPADRLGAGPPGSKNDYEALKLHPYFKGINFK
jgi:3-phosphoinositide dependent protein kinase-1